MAMSHMIRKRRRSSPGRGVRGLTLIEILIVLAIVGLMLYSLSVSIGAAGQAEVVRTTNQLASSIRFAYDRARYGSTHIRLLIDFEQRSFVLQQAEDAMYMPATNRDGELVEFDEKKAEQQAERDAQAEERYNASLASKILDNTGADGTSFDPYAPAKKTVPRRRPPLYQAFDDENLLSGVAEPIVLPEGVKIVSVRTDADFEPITGGQAALYFFPQGRTQYAHIQIQDEEADNKFTIVVQPLTGKVTIKEGLIDLELPNEVDDAEDDRGERRQRRTF